MKIDQLAHKKILILGYGKEGKATENFLRDRVPSAQITIADQAKNPDYLDAQFATDIVIKSPSIPPHLLKVPYTTATNIFFDNDAHFKIGVTGSKGKSTTSSLIYHILKTAGKSVYLIGNIGTPMISFLHQHIEKDAIFVIEMSSYQLEDIEFSPNISVIVSLFPDHLDHHGTVEQYYAAKKRIFAHAKPSDVFVFNSQFELLNQWADQAKCTIKPFIENLPEEIKSVPLLGEHNASNIRGAITVADLMGVERSSAAKAVATFQPLPHRLQPVGFFKKIQFYDDAISTTPESTIAAINSLPKIGTILLGGQNRGYNFAELIQLIEKKKIQNIVLFPDSGKEIQEQINKREFFKPRILHTDQMSQAVEFAFDFTPPGTICLLSTASPSYSVWKNFEEKGDMFQLWIQKIGHGQN